MTTVSLIVPCHNAARTLRLCLESVLAQTRRPDEIVVVDDASGDDSAAIAAELGARVIRLPENRGVSAARNMGVAGTSGDVIFFLDSDVALRPDAIENALAILEADPACNCAWGIYEPEPLIDDGPVEWYRILHAVNWGTRQTGEVTGVVFALAAIGRATFAETGGFDESLRDCEDIEYGHRLVRRTRIVLTDTIRGRHDDGHRLLPILAEQWRRSLPLIPLLVAARSGAHGSAGPGGADRGRVHANRPAGILACALAMALLPAGLFYPPALLVAAALLVVFVLADPPLLKLVHRHRGAAFTGYFMAVHLAVHVVLVTGLAVGCLRVRFSHQW
ncbi:glycosyltransferase family 2 protein [Spirillospora sp. NPDC048911]|uniref:glycosyltransferase family 2 protein n=1 Tax=Spirillospora sp. NPDC048911 TaxID=3364527 RepID=UPI0037123656